MNNLKTHFLRNKLTNPYCYTKIHDIRYRVIGYLWRNIFGVNAIYGLTREGGYIGPKLFLKAAGNKASEFQW